MLTRNTIYSAIAARHYNKMMINRSIAEKRARVPHTDSINNSLFVHVSTDTVITEQIVKRKYTPITHSIETSLCIRTTCNYSVNQRDKLFSARERVLIMRNHLSNTQ